MCPGVEDLKDPSFQMFDTNNNPAENLYTLEPVQGKGLGLIASRGLKGRYLHISIFFQTLTVVKT